jgi:sugar phosphate isomerase/epimerase
MMIEENGTHMKPSEVAADLDAAVRLCRQTHRLTPIAYSVDIALSDEDPVYMKQFAAICKLAKATKVVTIVVRSGELGTPYNAEIERLRAMVAIASLEGVRVGLLTESGRMTQDPDTAVTFCTTVKGLGITLDPSHYVCGPHRETSYDQILPYVYHVRLRDSSKDQLQVRVGQGLIEYGKLISQLARFKYDRALSVDITSMEGVDQMAEMRKMRLLLESLL